MRIRSDWACLVQELTLFRDWSWGISLRRDKTFSLGKFDFLFKENKSFREFSKHRNYSELITSIIQKNSNNSFWPHTDLKFWEWIYYSKTIIFEQLTRISKNYVFLTKKKNIFLVIIWSFLWSLYCFNFEPSQEFFCQIWKES